ncbi:UbiD family decarboxylase [Legionella sainthelensi]|uniref:UbiD family decarboxylase n=1 Tax=Legionella sainthelensi TaxID=28087 RepID=UPI001FD1F968|nr:UbiD family decarboxylase [Legionella sainthelensi]
MIKINNLRDWLEFLDNNNRLICLQDNIPLQYEVLRYIEHFEGNYACFFPKPGGHKIPVVGGLLGQRQWVAELLNIPEESLLSTFQRALKSPLDWQIIKQDKAPVHEVIHEKKIDLKALLPIITCHELDGGPYITSGLVHGLNLETGKQNLSIHRLQVQGPDKMSILMLPRDLFAYYQIAEKMEKPLPVTITIGHDPVIELASQAIAPRDLCELSLAGALKQQPIEVVKSYTNEVHIPAGAEIAIEGFIIPHKRVLEGPFGEFPKYYTGQDLLPYIQITCITHRRNPIYRVNNPSGVENVIIGGIPRESSILERMQINFPNILDVRLTAGGLGRYHLVVKMIKKQYGEAKNVIACAFGCHYDIKMVTVVDEDININDNTQIEWAMATRFQATRDVVIIKHGLGSKLDPSGDKRGLNDKIGFDATKYLGDEEHFYVSRIPARWGEVYDKLSKDNKFLVDYLKT